MIFLFYKYFKPYQTLNLVENNRKSYDIDVIHSSCDKKNNRKEGRKEEKERQTYRFFSGWSDSFYIWLFKRPTIAENSLRIDAVWSALLLLAHKYFWEYLFSMLKSAFRKGVQRIVY